MKKNVVIVVSSIIVILVMGLFLVLMKTDENENTYTDQEIKFKDEYESLNESEYGTSILKTVTIDSDSNVNYLSDETILDALKSGNKVIYFGWPECNWCRTMLPTLIKVLKSNDIETFYYYNFKELRAAYEEGKDLNKVKIYEDILSIIGDDITSTFAKDSNRSGEKKILAPTVVFIKDGNYVGLHVKTVDSQIKSSEELSKEQVKELEDIYQALVDKMALNVCSDEGC